MFAAHCVALCLAHVADAGLRLQAALAAPPHAVVFVSESTVTRVRTRYKACLPVLLLPCLDPTGCLSAGTVGQCSADTDCCCTAFCATGEVCIGERPEPPCQYQSQVGPCPPALPTIQATETLLPCLCSLLQPWRHLLWGLTML